MKKILIGSLCFFFFFCSFGQKKDLDFQATLTNYLTALGVDDKAGPTRLFAIAVHTDKSEKINKTRVYYYKDGSINFLENNSLLERFNARDLSQYTEDGCLPKQKSQQVILPFVLKRVKAVLSPKQEPVLNSADFENMIHLLRHVQKDSGVLGKPLVVFIEDSSF
jgi:hypothetical protein